MARPLSFDRERVVESAKRAFWRHGLHATSAEDLCQATGLGRSSLYNSFGSKDDLFAECLGSYLTETRAFAERILGDTTLGPLDRFATLLRLIAAEEVERNATDAPRGCLAVNTVTELADDPEYSATVRRIEEDNAARLTMYGDVIRAGQASGEITDAVSADGLAVFVRAAIAGLRIASQGGAPAAHLDDIVAATLRALSP
jgi:AcrR family transcriptional regulator